MDQDGDDAQFWRQFNQMAIDIRTLQKAMMSVQGMVPPAMERLKALEGRVEDHATTLRLLSREPAEPRAAPPPVPRRALVSPTAVPQDAAPLVDVNIQDAAPVDAPRPPSRKK
jgi:hypothetical protein